MARSATTFGAGNCANPKGRPKSVAAVRELAGVHTKAAIATLAGIMADEDEQATARVAAAKELLDRAHGKPAQGVEVTGKDGSNLLDNAPTGALLAFVKAWETM